MYLIYLLFWIILNGKITLEILIFGLVISAVMYWFTCKFLDYSIKKDILLVKSSGYLFYFAIVLIKEIIIANINVTKFVYSGKYVPEPAITYFNPGLESKIARVLLANSITLTPGTVSVSEDEGVFCVHALDKAYADGIDSCSFVRILKKMEDSWK